MPMNRRVRLAACLASIAFAVVLPVGGGQTAQEVRYATSADGSQQPAMFHAPESRTPVPLVVALHTWSAGYKQGHHKAIERWCIDKGWAYMHPHFRGPNKRPEATGSELRGEASVVQETLGQCNRHHFPGRSRTGGIRGHCLDREPP